MICSFHAHAQWVSKGGPEGGGIGSVVATSTTLFASAYSAGIYRSTDGGATWIPSKTEAHMDVRQLHVSGNTVFAGLFGSEKVTRSTDQGLTWQPANNGISIFQSVNCFAENEAGIWIGTYKGVLLTTDNGDTWVDKTSNIAQEYIVSMTTKGNKVFAGTTEGLFVSENNGDTWTLVEIDGPDDGSISAINTVGDKIFVSIQSGVYASTNDGETWDESGNGIVDATPVQFVQIGDKIYAPGVMSTFVSSNDGEDWSTTGIDGILVGSMTSFNGKIIAGSYPNGIMISTNGTDWAFSNTGLHARATHDLITVHDKMVVASLVGIFQTTDNGGWEFLESTTDFIPLALATQSDSIYAATNAGLYLSTDKGATWEYADLGGEYMADVEFGDGVIYALSRDKFFVSTNKGETWTPKTDGLPSTSFYCLAVKGDDVFVGTFAEGVYMSSNKGDIWTEVNTGLEDDFDRYVFNILVDGDNLYAATDGKIFRSTNNAESWENVTGDSNITANFLMSSGSHIYAATDRGVFVSGVNSNVWDDISFNLGPTENNRLLSTSETILVGTSGLGVMEMPKVLPSVVTPNEGPVNSTVTITGGLFGGTIEENIVDFNGTPATISSARVTELQVKVPEGATSGPVTIKFGDITIDAGVFTIKETPVTGIGDTNETKFVVSPNPFRNALTVNRPGTVHLRLMDAVGKPIMQSYVNGRIELPGLAAGVYFATITADGNSQTVKLVKVD